MSAEKIISDLKQKKFRPVYWLEGDENFYIDEIMNYAEHHILSEQEAGFNLSVFYGKDANWAEVMNACRRYPMFGDKQLVLLKEAQQMRDLDKLEPYIEHPLASTIFIVAHKEGRVDGRSKMAKSLKKNAEILTTKKLYENQLPDWLGNYVHSKGYSIKSKALYLLIDHIGNDLSRLTNEINKIIINMANRKEISEDDIELYVGVSKEYNAFELQNAIAGKDLYNAIRIINYFESNPKAAPIQLILPALYNFFSKVYMLFGINSKDEKTLAAAAGIPPFFIKDYMSAAQRYGLNGVTRILLLLHHYNLKSVGIDVADTPDASLLKEMVVKMIRE